MKTTHLPSLLLTLTLLMGIVPTVRTVEPLNRLNAVDATDRLLSDLAIRVPTERRDRPFSATSASSVPSVVQSAASDWQIECVDCPRSFWRMSDRSLRLDSDGQPRIAYGGERLYYAWHSGTEWHYETVDNSPGGQYTSLALDALGRPRISYTNKANGDLKYARYDGTSWHLETVDGGGWVDSYTSLALDESDRPHISYINNGLKYAWYDGVAWQVTAVDSEGGGGTLDGNGGDTSLVLDELGRPHIGYYRNANLMHAWRDGVTWQVETVSDACDYYVSLVLDGTDYLHAACIGGGVKHIWHDGISWQVETVDGASVSGRYVSLALDSSGWPHIGYYDDYPYHDLKHAWHDGTSWQIETVEHEEVVGWYISLALDQAGRPYISYMDGDGFEGDLKFARYDGTAWHIETVDSAKNAGEHTSLALDEADHPHISYSGSDLKYARYDGSVWYIETVDDGWSGPTSLALDRSSRPHIGYIGDGLKYAWHNETGWHTEMVDAGGNGWGVSLALDSLDRPHVIYYHPDPDDYYNGDLRYARRDEMGWYIETVTRIGYTTLASLALDRSDRPHVVYGDCSLRYVWHDGSTWRLEWSMVVGSTFNNYNSLVLDQADRPHISYIGYYNGIEYLEYIWHDGSSWQVQTVDSGRRMGSYNSLALDELGQPHVSYYDWDNEDLKYAQHDGADWQIETVDSEGRVGLYTSLALDGSGHPYISYYDNTNRDLKYAYLLPPLSLDKQASPIESLYDNHVLTRTLTYTLTLFGPGLSVRLWDSLPDTIRYVSGSVTSTLTPTAVYSSTAHAVVWEGTLPTDTAQMLRFQVTPQITDTRLLSAPMSIVNTAWLTVAESSRAISATAIVNIAPPPLSLGKRAAPGDGLYNNDTLTYTLILSGPGLNVCLWDPLPPSVRYISGSITDTIASISGTVALPAAVYSPTAHAVLWKGTLPTDTVEVIRFQVTPGITGTGSLSLSLPIVNTAWLTATESGRSVSATVIVNGWHLYLPLMLRDN